MKRMTAHHVESVHETGQSIAQAVQESRPTEQRQVVTRSPAIEQESIIEPITSMPVSQTAVEQAEPVERSRYRYEKRALLLERKGKRNGVRAA